MLEVVIYTTPSCGYCKVAKAFFQEHNVAYQEKDVTKDAQARDFLIKNNQTDVPVITVGQELVVGFDKARLSQLLGI